MITPAQSPISAPNTCIDWNYDGKTDPLMGTGANRAERLLVYASSFFGLLLIGYLHFFGNLNWSWWQALVAALIATDIAGGVTANSLNSCKRFYHTPQRPDEPGYIRWIKNPRIFAALHIYPLLVGLLFDAFWNGLFWYIAMVASILILLKMPLYLHRPAALALVFISLVVNLYLIRLPPGFEWLAPALFLKIVYGHTVREEPYRPAKEGVK
jgi:hypothetical protein